MKKFGFLSFGHYRSNAGEALKNDLKLAQEADAVGVDGAFLRVHHFAPQHAAPVPLLAAIAATTKNIEVGTGVIDMRYENPLYLAEELAALDLIADGRIAVGISRGSPEPARRGWEAFGYENNPREKFLQFLQAIDGVPQAEAAGLDEQYPQMYAPGTPLPVMPQSPGLRRRIWWGSGSYKTAEQAARDGVNLMSSTLVFETDGASLGEIQAEQIRRYRAAWQHPWTPRVSVSRTVFPILDDADYRMFGAYAHSREQIGHLDDGPAVFGRTMAAEPDRLVEELNADPAVRAADTLLLTIPSQLGAAFNAKILANFAEYIRPRLLEE